MIEFDCQIGDLLFQKSHPKSIWLVTKVEAAAVIICGYGTHNHWVVNLSWSREVISDGLLNGHITRWKVKEI